MDSMYVDVNNYHHGVCDPHMTGGQSLAEMIDCDMRAAFGFDDANTSPEGFQNVDPHLSLFDDVLNEPTVSSDLSWSNLTPTFNNPSISSALSTDTDSVLSGGYLDDFGHGTAGIVSVDPNAILPVAAAAASSASQHHHHHHHRQQQQQSSLENGALSVNTQYTNVQQQQQHSNIPSPAAASAHPSPVGYPPEALMGQQRQIQMPQLSPLVTSSYQTAATVSLQPIQIRAAAPHQLGTTQQQQQQQTIVRPNVVVNSGAKTVKVLLPPGSPMQQVPELKTAPAGGGGGIARAQAAAAPNSLLQQQSNSARKKNQKQAAAKVANKENGYPKPAYSYSCLIALSLKNSSTGSLSVSEIYRFMCEHFPYFRTAPSGWKNSVRHNLSLNKCFEKIVKPAQPGSNQRKGCLWAMNPAKITKMDEEVLKWSRKDPMAIKKGMVAPHTLEKLERGEMKKDYNANTTANGSTDSEDEDDPKTPTSVSSQCSSQGCDSIGSDLVDIEGNFSAVQDSSSLPELHLQSSGIFEGLIDDRMQYNNGMQAARNNHVVRLAGNPRQRSPAATATATAGGGFYPTAIQTVHGNYAIAPAAVTQASGASNVVVGGGMKTLVVTRQEGSSRVYTVGGPTQ